MIMILMLAISMGLIFYLFTMVVPMGGSTHTITEIKQVETTCIHCRRMRKFTIKGPYR